MSQSTPHRDPQMESVRQSLDGIRGAARHLKKNLEGGRAVAATPDGRQRIVDTRAYLAEWRILLAAAVRDLADVDRVLDKTLKKHWGIRV